MTRNQLQYWELAWKQHYQNVELTLRAYELALQADKQKLDWAKLDEQIRATLVAEAINERKQILSEFAAELEVHYKAAQVQKMVTEIETMKQQLYLTLVKDTASTYTNMTKEMIDIYSKIANININVGGSSGKKGGISGGLDIKLNPLFIEMTNVAKELGAKRDEFTKIQESLQEYLVDHVNTTTWEKQPFVPSIDKTKDNLHEALEEHTSTKPKYETKTNQTSGPGISEGNVNNKHVDSNASQRNTKRPTTRESQGPSNASIPIASGVRIVSSGNGGPGMGIRSNSSSGRSSNVIISPGVKISSGPG